MTRSSAAPPNSRSPHRYLRARRRSAERAARLAVAPLGSASSTQAAPEKIQVYLDDATAPGKFGLDLHNNLTLSGSREPDYPGAQATHRCDCGSRTNCVLASPPANGRRAWRCPRCVA